MSPRFSLHQSFRETDLRGETLEGEAAVVVVTRLVKRATKPRLASKDILKHLRYVLCGARLWRTGCVLEGGQV